MSTPPGMAPPEAAEIVFKPTGTLALLVRGYESLLRRAPRDKRIAHLGAHLLRRLREHDPRFADVQLCHLRFLEAEPIADSEIDWLLRRLDAADAKASRAACAARAEEIEQQLARLRAQGATIPPGVAGGTWPAAAVAELATLRREMAPASPPAHAPAIACPSRPRTRSRERRAVRRTGSSSRTSGADPSDDDGDPEPPPARVCACGCGRDISHKRSDARTFDAGCRKRLSRAELDVEIISAEKLVSESRSQSRSPRAPRCARLDDFAWLSWLMASNGTVSNAHLQRSPWAQSRVGGLRTRPEVFA